MFLIVVKHENSKIFRAQIGAQVAENYEVITLRSMQKFHQVEATSVVSCTLKILLSQFPPFRFFLELFEHLQTWNNYKIPVAFSGSIDLYDVCMQILIIFA